MLLRAESWRKISHPVLQLGPMPEPSNFIDARAERDTSAQVLSTSDDTSHMEVLRRQYPRECPGTGGRNVAPTPSGTTYRREC